MTRLEKFQRDSEAVSKYHKGIRLLEEAGVDLVLMERIVGSTVNIAHPHSAHMATATHHESIGYQNCLTDLLSLDKAQVSTPDMPVADYGATEKMRESGELTAEQEEEIARY